MNKSLSESEKVQLMKAVGEDLKNLTKSHIIAIYGALEDNTGELIGSGTLIKHRGKKVILTANHVIEKVFLDKYSSPAVSSKVDNSAFKFEKDNLRWFNKNLDVAIIDHPAPNETPDHFFLDSSNIDLSVGNIDNDMLFIHGFTGEKSRFIPFGESGIHSSTLPYTTVQGKSQYDWFDPSIHFAIEYPGLGQEDELDNNTDLPNPRGLSGSAVWAARLDASNSNKWSKENAKIIGISHNWDDKSQSLVCTRIEKFLSKLAPKK